MKHKITLAVMSLVAVFGVMSFVPSVAVHASPASQIKSGVNKVGGSGQKDLGSSIKTIVNMMLYLLGAVSVVMIVIGGIRYATSNGDASAITGAKNTILYAVIGLIVAIMAYSIVNFVVGAF